MRVALLFYGQPRFTSNPLPLESHREHILDKYDTDVYVHTWWSQTDSEYDCSSWATIKDCPVEPDALGKILDYYEPKVINCNSPRKFEFTPESQKYVDRVIAGAIARNPSSERHWSNANFSNIISQMFSIEEVTKLCLESDQKYDFIIMSRLDNYITEFPNLNELDPNEFYTNDLHQRFPDMLYFFGQRFLESHLFYSNLDDMIERYYESFWEPSAEAFKLHGIARYFDDETEAGRMEPEKDLVPTRIRVYAVRDNTGNGQ